MVVRRRVIVHGRVQGVFFRDTTRRHAQTRGLSGWVRNRHDGTVEAVFEGEPEAVERMLRFCREGPRGAAVESVEVFEEEPEGVLSRTEGGIEGVPVHVLDPGGDEVVQVDAVGELRPHAFGVVADQRQVAFDQEVAELLVGLVELERLPRPLGAEHVEGELPVTVEVLFDRRRRR